MNPRLAALLVLGAGLVGCVGEGKSDAERAAEWCSAFDRYAVMIRDEVMAADPPLDPTSREALEIEERIQSFTEMDVPGQIEDDWLLALPRGANAPEGYTVEQFAARLRSTQWIVDNCDLSADVDVELRQQMDSDRDVVGNDAPRSTST